MVVMIPGSEDSEDHIILKKAVSFFARRLIEQELIDQLTIRIQPIEANQDFHAQTNWVAWNEFVFELNVRLAWLMQLQALAHETVHASQYISGRLHISDCEQYMIWTDRTGQMLRYPIEDFHALQRTSDYNQRAPWEREAYFGEAGLTLEFLKTVVITPKL